MGECDKYCKVVSRLGKRYVNTIYHYKLLNIHNLKQKILNIKENKVYHRGKKQIV